MLKWLKLLIISAALFCLFNDVQLAREISALFVLGLGTDLIISEVKKPIKR